MRTRLLLSFAVVFLAGVAVADEPTCTMVLSGGAQGTVPCKVTFMSLGGSWQLGVGAGPTPKPVTAHLMVGFKEAPTAKAYGFDAVESIGGTASAEAVKGVVWEMDKGGPSKIPGVPPSPRKGEVSLVLSAVGKRPAEFHGKATMTLLPVNYTSAVPATPVKVDVSF